jgi:uncharacterized protein
LLAAALLYMRFEATWLKTEHVARAKGSKGLKVLHLSDIHINKLKVSHKKVRDVIARENPDVVILSGDYIEEEKDIPEFLRFLSYIKGNSRVYMCLGNHDYEAFSKNEKGLARYMKNLEDAGVELLHNRSACVEKNSKKYNIIGIADIRYKHHNIDKALASCCPDAFMNIAFSHNPDLVLQLPRNKVDYLLCGHFHGGQIWAPFNLEFKLLRREKLCRMGVQKGLHKVNGVNLYINRGLGNVVVPLRFMSRPEIAVFQFP